MSLHDLIPVLQLAVGPVILVSGVGLILLSMTNRFGRVIDRSRALSVSLESASAEQAPRTVKQLRILVRRARIIRAGIAAGVLSVLLAAVLVIALFVGELLRLPIVLELVGCFVACLTSLIVCLVLFLYDINLSLKALWLEIPAEAQTPSED